MLQRWTERYNVSNAELRQTVWVTVPRLHVVIQECSSFHTVAPPAPGMCHRAHGAHRREQVGRLTSVAALTETPPFRSCSGCPGRGHPSLAAPSARTPHNLILKTCPSVTLSDQKNKQEQKTSPQGCSTAADTPGETRPVDLPGQALSLFSGEGPEGVGLRGPGPSAPFTPNMLQRWVLSQLRAQHPAVVTGRGELCPWPHVRAATHGD